MTRMIRFAAAASVVAGGAVLSSPSASLASDWLDQALESGEALLRDAEEAAGDATDTMGRWADDATGWFERQFNDGSALTAEQVRQFVSDMAVVNDYAIDAGYRLERFDVTLGVVPQVLLHYALDPDLPTEDLTTLVERIEADDLSILQRYVLSALLTASEYAEPLQVGDYALRGVRITLAVPPSVRLVFAPDHAGPVTE